MANEFVREPVVGGDANTWANYLMPMVRDARGVNNASMFIDGADLKIKPGRIGIDDNTNEGIALVDTETTIDISAASAGNWAQIQLEIVGVTLVFSALDISGATDEKTIPVEFTSGYVPEKAGFYLDPTKRTIGLIWKNAGGTLKGVVNAGNNLDSYYGNVELASGETYMFTKNYDIETAHYETPVKYSQFGNNSTYSFGASTSWRTAELNTTINNDIPSVSLGSNQITIPPGKYRIVANIMPSIVNASGSEHGCRLYNITDGALEAPGLGTTGSSSGGDQYVNFNIETIIDISVSTVFELQFRSSNGFVIRVGPTNSYNTMFTIVRIS